jgi:ferredoxin--NADP+ reductase
MTPDQIDELRRTRYNATVDYLHKPNPELMILRVRPDEPVAEHEPGQNCSIGLGYWEPRFPGSQIEELDDASESRVVLRPYSISHPILLEGVLAPRQHEWLEFYVVLVRTAIDQSRAPGLTPRLFMLRVGERLKLGKHISGQFNLDGVKPNDTVVFLSTGTGEAPHNYMLWELLRRGHSGRILSVCCVRFRRDLAYLATHERLMQMFPNYSYLGLTTREEAPLGHKIYIQDLIASGQLEERLGKSLDPVTCHVFLCGNPKMIGMPETNAATGERVYPRPAGVIELLERRGFQIDNPRSKFRGNIHFESYW